MQELDKLTVKHNWNSRLVVDQGREGEDADLMGQLDVVRLDKLDAMLVSVIVDGLQFLQNARAGLAVVVI